MSACTRIWMETVHLGSSRVVTRTSRVVFSPICLAPASLRSHHRRDAMITGAQNVHRAVHRMCTAHRALMTSKPRERERVLFSSHQKIEGPVDQWLLSQVDLIVTAMPAMRGPADQSVLRQLLNAAENLDSTRSKYIEYPEPSELDKAYTNEHQPKVHKRTTPDTNEYTQTCSPMMLACAYKK